MSQLSMHDLDAHGAELLPAREALNASNWANVDAFNLAAAANFGSDHAEATAKASQLVAISQD